MLPVIVIDTCVFVAAFRSRTGASFRLVRRIGFDFFEIAVTTPLLLEYEDVLLRSPEDLGLTSDDTTELINYLCRVGRQTVVRFRTRPTFADPADEHVLEAAVAAGADWIVTHNLRHLRTEAMRFGIEVLTPGEALRQLGENP